MPASFTNLVGVRVTPGLISRNGMSSLVVFQDTAGPMARTVKDAAILLDSSGRLRSRPMNTRSAALVGRNTGSYVDAMDTKSMHGARLGVVRNVFADNDNPSGAAVNRVVEEALAKVKAAGANLVDVEIPDLDALIEETSFLHDTLTPRYQ